MSALTNHQKQRLAILAREAYAAAPQADRDAADFNDWRHQQVAKACGKLGLRCASQTDYKSIEAHFLHLLGREAEALNAHLAAQTEPRRQAMAVLKRNCHHAGVALAYAGAICRTQYRCDLDQATEKQLWSLVFTVRNRAKRNYTKTNPSLNPF